MSKTLFYVLFVIMYEKEVKKNKNLVKIVNGYPKPLLYNENEKMYIFLLNDIFYFQEVTIMGNSTVIFTGPCQVEMQEKERPCPGAGEVLIRTEQSLISTGTELTFLKGEYPENSKWSTYINYPMSSGYSNIGVIEDVGEGVAEELVGKRVASFSGHAQYVIAKAEELRMINYDIDPEHATFFALAETTINGIRRTGIEFGNRVVVYGAGIVGQLAARLLLAGGCTEIFVVNRSEKRLEILPKSPAIIPICSSKEDPVEVVRRVTKGEMADIVIETTGNADVIPEEFLVLHQQGKFCMLSSPKKKTLIDFHDCSNAISVNIIGAHTSSQAPVATYDNPWTCERNSETFFKMIHNGQIDMSGMVTHRASYKEAPEMYQMLLNDRTQAMGVVLDWR